MSAVFETFDHYSHPEQGKIHHIASAAWHWLGAALGCPHKEMSRPFSRQGETYRVCINCGARRNFDQKTWKPVGPYYFRPASTRDLMERKLSSVRECELPSKVGTALVVRGLQLNGGTIPSQNRSQ